MRWPWRRRTDASTAAVQPDAVQSRFARIRGRRYDSAMAYMLPKDDAEIQRLDFQHFLLRNALRGNYRAPFAVDPRTRRENTDAPFDILDVGTGTGRWAMEIASLFSASNVIGVDMVAPPSERPAPLGAGLDRRPDNYVFVQGNVLEQLPFADNSFHFTHMRLLYSAIPAVKWPDVMSELVRVTRPGGWIEQIEAASVERRGPAVDRMNSWVVEACARRGLDMTVGTRLGDMQRAAGLRDIQFHAFDIPVGRWGGRIGVMMKTDIVAILKAVGPLVVTQGLATQDEFEQTIREWEHEADTREMIFPFYLACGQVPGA